MNERPILTEDDLKLEIQGARCREALRVLEVPEHILKQFPSGPLLFQFAHMSVFLEVPWRDALTWVNDHRGEIFNHSKIALAEKAKPVVEEKLSATDVG